MQNPLLESTKDCNRVPNDPETELEICSFYIQIIKDLFEMYHPPFEIIRNSLLNIRSYKNPEVEVHDIVSFDDKADRFAYIFAYCFMHSVVMYDRFSNMLKSNPTMADKIASMTKLRLCLLGGGPGFEAVSICKIFNYLRRQNEDKCRPLSLNVTIIDVCKGWENDAELIMSSAQKEISPSSDIKIDFKFIVADLTVDFSEDVTKALKKAHIVTMFKFLSDVNDSCYAEREVHCMIHKIIDCMSFRACLFLLDNAGGNIFKKTDKMIDELSQASKIYKAAYNCHRLSLDSVELVSGSLRNIFRYLKCTAQTTISCAAWLKIRHIISANELTSGISGVSLNNSVQDPEPHKLKSKSRKVKVKKTYQSASKIEELSCNNDTDSSSLLVPELQSTVRESTET